MVGVLGTEAGQHGERHGRGWDQRCPQVPLPGVLASARATLGKLDEPSLKEGRRKERREGGDSPSTSTEHVCSEAHSDLSSKRLSSLQRGGGLVASGPGLRRGLPTPEITLVPLVPRGQSKGMASSVGRSH